LQSVQSNRQSTKHQSPRRPRVILAYIAAGAAAAEEEDVEAVTGDRQGLRRVYAGDQGGVDGRASPRVVLTHGVAEVAGDVEAAAGDHEAFRLGQSRDQGRIDHRAGRYVILAHETNGRAPVPLATRERTKKLLPEMARASGACNEINEHDGRPGHGAVFTDEI